MLRIKDNLGLKELKKFGFLEAEKYYYYPIVDCVVELRIWKTDRVFYINVNDYEDVIENIDLLFNIIEAGLVEKV